MVIKLYMLYYQLFENIETTLIVELVANIITIVAFLFGLYQFWLSAESNKVVVEIQKQTLEAQKLAIEKFQSFIQLQSYQIDKQKEFIKPHLKLSSPGSESYGSLNVVKLYILTQSNTAKNLVVSIENDELEFIILPNYRKKSVEINILKLDKVKPLLITSIKDSLIDKSTLIEMEKIINVKYEDLVSNLYVSKFQSIGESIYREVVD